MSVDDILAGQAGVIGRDQALRAGLSRHAVDQQLRLRRWRPLHPRVYLASGHRYDHEARIRAAALWAGEGAVVGGVAAAWWHGMTEQPPATVAVTAPRQRHSRARQGVTVHRRRIAVEDVVERRGLRVTAPALSALEAAVELGDRGSSLLDLVLQRGVGFPAVYDAHRRNLGSSGSVGAGRMLAAAADRSAPVAVRLLVGMLRDSGAAGWRRGFPAAGYLIDVAFPASRVGIEVHGWAWRPDAERRRGAAEHRRNVLVRNGWTLLRYTWHDLSCRPRAVLAEISHEVERGRAFPGSIVGRVPNP